MPDPPLSVTVAMPLPSPKFTVAVPVGVPPDELTSTVKLACWPLTVAPPEATVVDVAAGLTVNPKLCVASDPTPFEAVMVIGNEPALLDAPESVAVPLPLSTKVTALGSEPLLLSAGVG